MLPLVIRRADREPKLFEAVGWSEHLYVVYLAVNVKNGKIYVGATQKGVRARKLKHFANAERGQAGKFYNAIRKHGRVAFKFLVLRECKDYWDALDAERELIASLKPDYNLTDGGGGIKGFKMPESAKAKMRAAKVGKPGHPCPEWLKKKNAELRRSERGRIHPYSWRPVECLNDGKKFASVKEAAAYYGITSPDVSISCTKNRSRQGLLFRRIAVAGNNVQ